MKEDCVQRTQVVVTGDLNVTGIPDADGKLPAIVGGGSNRLFKVESGGELVVKSLNLTGGVASGSGEDGIGGGIFVDGASTSFKSINCSFEGNNASVSGGATAEPKPAPPTLARSFPSPEHARTVQEI